MAVDPPTPALPEAFTALSAGFDALVDIDATGTDGSLLALTRSLAGLLSLDRIAPDATRSVFVSLDGLGAVRSLAVAREGWDGASRGGFATGTVFLGTDPAGQIARCSGDGLTLDPAWVRLPGEAGTVDALFVDRSGAFDGDLLAGTSAGSLWRVSAAGEVRFVAHVGAGISSLITLGSNRAKYGPWSGAILAASSTGRLFVVTSKGEVRPSPFQAQADDLDEVEAGARLYGVDAASGTLLASPDWLAAPRADGDVLVTSRTDAALLRVSWTGEGFEQQVLAEHVPFGRVAFARVMSASKVDQGAGVLAHATSRKAISINGRVEGSVRQLLDRDTDIVSTTVTGNATITGDLYVPGTPSVVVNGHPSYGGLVTGTGSIQPSAYTVTIGGNATLGHLVNRTDAVPLPVVEAPPLSAGTRDVTISGAGQSVGDFATLRNLTLQSGVGPVAIPAGTYNSFSAAGGSSFRLGVAGSSQPAVYNLQSLTLSGQSSLEVVGPVRLVLATGIVLNASSGNVNQALWLSIDVASGDVTLNGGSALYGVVRAPAGTVTVGGNSRLVGSVWCNKLVVLGGGLLTGVADTTAPQLSIDTPAEGAVIADTHTIVTGTVSDQTSVSVTVGSVAAAITGTSWSADVPLSPGENTLVATGIDAFGNSAQVTRTVTQGGINHPPLVDAGADQTAPIPGSVTLQGTASDDSLPEGSSLSIAWSKVSGPGEVTFSSTASLDTSASFSEPGVYVLRLTASDGALTGSDDVSVTAERVNQAPVVDAGSDQTVVLPQAASLSGSATDDGLPVGSHVTSTWSVVSTPGGGASVSFADAHAASTTATFSAPGAYVLRLTASDSLLTSSDDLQITVERANLAPVVSAGADASVRLPETAALSGTTSDDGLPVGTAVTASWSTVSGPGTVTFTDPASASTTASFSMPGTYLLRLTASDSLLSTSDEVQITVLPANQAPVVSAGADQQLRLPQTAALSGSAIDDGVPEGSPLVSTWSLASGPGEVTFADAHALSTTASFSIAGTYVLRLTTSDSRLDGSDELTVTVLPANQAPVVSAGADQTVEFPATATLGAIVTDDGVPEGSSLTLTWAKASGPGEVTFANASAASTTAAFSAPGTYVLRVTASDSQLSTSDELTVTVEATNQPPVVSAGPDVSVALPDNAILAGTASDDGLPSGSALTVVWSTVSGPGTVTFAPPNTTTTSVSFSAPGVYVLRLTASDTRLTTSDEVTVTVTPPNQAPTVSAGEDLRAIVEANLLVNPSNEAPLALGELSGWHEVEGTTWEQATAGTDGFPTPAHGATFFASREATSAELRQDVDVRAWSSRIGAGLQRFEFVGFARSKQESLLDVCRIVVEYRDTANGAVIASFDSGPISTSTAWAAVADTRLAPEGTGWIRVRLITTSATGSADGYFDALSLRALGTASVRLSGQVTDPTLPPGSTLAATWSFLSGPGAASFGSTGQAETIAVFDTAGVYELELEATDGLLAARDTVLVTVEGGNAPPVVDAGTDQSATLPASLVLSVGSSRVDLQACKLEYSIVSPK